LPKDQGVAAEAQEEAERVVIEEVDPVEVDPVED